MGEAKVTWEKLPCVGDKPCGRYGHAMALVGDVAFVFGGMGNESEDEPTFYNDMYALKLSGKTPEWRKVKQGGDVPCGREGHSLTAKGKLLYLFGGSDNQDSEQCYNEVHVFDTETSEWSQPAVTGTPPASRLNHSAALVSGKLYIFGGYHDGEAFDDMGIFDPDTNSWATIPPLAPVPPPKARCDHVSAVVGDSQMYVLGGSGGAETYFNDVHCYDCVVGEWSGALKAEAGKPFSKRDFHTVVVTGAGDATRLWVFGGSLENEKEDIFKHFSDVTCYSPATREWVPVSVEGDDGAKPSGRCCHTAVVYASRMIVFGGTNDDEDFDEVWALSGVGSDGRAAKAAANAHIEAALAGGGGGGAAKAGAVSTVAAPSSTSAPAPAPAAVAAVDNGVPPPALDLSTELPIPHVAVVVPIRDAGPTEPRDFGDAQARVEAMIAEHFALVSAKFAELDGDRAQLNAEIEAFKEEKVQQAELHVSQQKQLQEKVEEQRAGFVKWLAERQEELAAERQELADMRAQLSVDRDQLTADCQAHEGVVAQFKEEEAEFKDKSEKMQAIMQQFQGIAK